MPVEPVLFPNTSIFRLLAPQKWQTFHRDWHMRYGREIYRKHNSGIFALVSLFQTDKIFVADPEMFVELKVTRADRFQIDTMEAEKVTVSLSEIFESVCSVNVDDVDDQINVYGPNLVGLVGSEWKRHRRIASKAFPQKTIGLVSTETKRQVLEMTTEWEKNMSNGKVRLNESLSLNILRLIEVFIKRRPSWLCMSLAVQHTVTPLRGINLKKSHLVISFLTSTRFVQSSKIF